MKLKKAELQALTFVDRGSKDLGSFWIAKVLVSIEEGDISHNSVTDIRISGAKDQTFAEVEELALKKLIQIYEFSCSEI